MATKITELTPILVEKTCDKCGGYIRLVKECDDGFHLLRNTKYWYEYKCEKCGDTIVTENPIILRTIKFINKETDESYKLIPTNGLFIQT